MDTVVNLHHNEPDLRAKLAVIECHKSTEDAARAARHKAEAELIELLGCPQEGQETHDIEDRKIVITQKINRKFNAAALTKIRNDIPEDLLPLKVQEVLDVKRLRYLQNNEPDTYRILSRAIVSQPAKPNIKIEKLQQADQPGTA